MIKTKILKLWINLTPKEAMTLMMQMVYFFKKDYDSNHEDFNDNDYPDEESSENE